MTVSLLFSLELFDPGDAVSDEELEHFGGDDIIDVGVVATVDGDSGEMELVCSFSFPCGCVASVGMNNSDGCNFAGVCSYGVANVLLGGDLWPISR